MLPDDHPWPELGSVSRGATRGNQGSKGSLSPPNSEGRCVLQLRVQPGVLAVTLTRQASEWYRTLDDAVTNALKLTKGYWRKARRRQDYDAQADQDHIELNEWLQQLKDKVMAHLEMLIAKGEIRGPPYTMSDEQEFTFLRKFIERQTSGISHNPRLRGLTQDNRVQPPHPLELPRSETPEDSKNMVSFHDDGTRLLEHNHNVASSTSSLTTQATMRPPSQSRLSSLVKDAQSNKQDLEAARRTLSQARKEAQTALQKYTSLLEAERRAQNALAIAEERRGELMASFVDFYNTSNTAFSTGGSPIPADSRPASTQFPPQMLSSSHHSMPSPSFATTSRHTVTSPLSTWDTDRQERSTPTFNNGATVAVNQFTNNDRQGHWTQHDGRINMNGNGLNHPDPTAMRQTLQPIIPITQGQGFMSQMPVGRTRKHGRDWGYGEMEEHSTDHEDLSGMSSRKRPHQLGSSLRVQPVSELHLVPPPGEGLSASQPPSHLSAPPNQFRDANA